jgi:hypothetical protein
MRSLLIAFLMAGSAWTATLPKLTVLLSIEGKAAPVALDEMKSARAVSHPRANARA